MYKHREILYLLKDDKETIHAMSDSYRDIQQYYLQFKNYFDENFDLMEIVNVSNKFTVNKLMEKYGDSLLLTWLTDSIILTEIEAEYYNSKLLKIYDDTKDMMSQMIVINQISNFSGSDKKKITDTFDLIYGNIKSFNDFINSIDSRTFFAQYIVPPNICKELRCMDRFIKDNIN